MIINKETAMKLWVKRYGKAIKITDFSGRVIVKAAYDDRNSKFGWNVDHILPQSKGGKTTESNLICCHILTNDEKANSFPCFTANNKKFEIIKVENHYEIRSKEKSLNMNNDDNVNFFDSASGIKFYKKLKGLQNKQTFVGQVFIELKNLKNTALIDFINELFQTDINYSKNNNTTLITIKDYNMPLQSDIQQMLDNCILLNTYLSKYFVLKDIIDAYSIFFGVHSFSDKLRTLTFNNVNDYTQNLINNGCHNGFLVNENVVHNTDLKKEQNLKIFTIDNHYFNGKIYCCNFLFTKLANNLIKEVEK